MITKSTLPSNTGFYGTYDRSYDIPFRYTCNGDDLLTGIQVRSADVIDGVDKLYCTAPKDIMSGTQYEVPTPDFGGNGGTARAPFICPAGSAIDQMNGSYHTQGYLYSGEFICRDIKNGSVTARSPFYGTVVGVNPFTAKGKGALTGFSGTGWVDSYIGKLQVMSGDYTPLRNSLTEEGKLQCCMGQNSSLCSLKPYTAECDSLMRSHCSLNPGDPRCKCIQSKVPCPQTADVDCKATGYKTSDMQGNCQINYNDCRMYNNLDANSTVALSSFKQTCAAGGGDGTTSKIDEKEAVIPESSAMNGTLLIVGVLLFLLFIIMIVIIAIVISKKQKKKRMAKNAVKHRKM